MKHLILLGFIAATLPALAADRDAHAFSVTLPAADEHEECMHLKVNEATKAQRGTFVAKSGEDYCWMWTAGKVPARIEGRIAAP
jgi:hypothetical protein